MYTVEVHRLARRIVMLDSTPQDKLGLLDRLARGPVICAEGYLFECERRGYLQAGAFVPEVVLDHPEVVAELHREFVHAGSDVVEAVRRCVSSAKSISWRR